MTVRLLKPYAQRPAGAITSALDASTEAGLIAAGKASADLVGGTRYFLPKSGIALQPKVVAVGAISLKIEEQATCELPEGQVLKVTGGAGAVGEVMRLGSSDKWSIGSGTMLPIGPFAGLQKFLMTCTAGSIDATVGDAVLGALTKSYNTNTPTELVMKTYLQSAGIAATPAYNEGTPTLIAGNRYYIDPVNGVDAANGLTPATAWKNLTKILGLNPGNGAVIHLANGEVFEYPEPIATYLSVGRLFGGNGCGSLRSTNAAAPIIIKPYNARPTSGAKPIIRYYGTIAASDWTQETGLGLGPNIWSFPCTTNPTIYDFALAYGPDNKISVGAHQQVDGVPYSPGNDPAQLKNIGDVSLKTGQQKIYCYCPANPTSYFGSVKMIMYRPVFSSQTLGLHNVKFYNLQFELCTAVSMSTTDNGTVPVTGLEIAHCAVKKGHIGYFNNQMTNAAPQECAVTVRDCYLEDTPGSGIRTRTGGADGSSGTAGNTLSFEVYRNTLMRGNLHSSNGGALLYNQAYGGTKHHAWGNYVFGALNGTGGNNADGAAIYSDVYARNFVASANIVKQCGMPFQLNNVQNGHVSGNFAIDCLTFGLFSGVTLTAFPSQSYRVIHNTWLWTGQVEPSSIQMSPGIGISNWGVNAYVFRQYVDGTGGGTSKVDFALANNLAILVSDSGFSSKGAYAFVSASGTPGAFLTAGLAAIGFSTANKVAVDGGVDVSANPSVLTYNGPASDAYLCMADPANGSAVLSIGSPLIARGVALSVSYTDIRGRNFSGAAPTPGCYEPQS